MSNNRNPIIQWSITFPQTEMERKAFVDMFPPCIMYVCAQEEHKDGGHHLHLGIKFKKGITFSNLRKWIMKKFPEDWKRIKFEAVKVWKNWADYCLKEDVDAIQWREKKAGMVIPSFIKPYLIEEGLIIMNEDGFYVKNDARIKELNESEVNERNRLCLERVRVKEMYDELNNAIKRNLRRIEHIRMIRALDSDSDCDDEDEWEGFD